MHVNLSRDIPRQRTQQLPIPGGHHAQPGLPRRPGHQEEGRSDQTHAPHLSVEGLHDTARAPLGHFANQRRHAGTGQTPSRIVAVECRADWLHGTEPSRSRRNRHVRSRPCGENRRAWHPRLPHRGARGWNGGVPRWPHRGTHVVVCCQPAPRAHPGCNGAGFSILWVLLKQRQLARHRRQALHGNSHRDSHKESRRYILRAPSQVPRYSEDQGGSSAHRELTAADRWLAL